MAKSTMAKKEPKKMAVKHKMAKAPHEKKHHESKKEAKHHEHMGMEMKERGPVKHHAKHKAHHKAK